MSWAYKHRLVSQRPFFGFLNLPELLRQSTSGGIIVAPCQDGANVHTELTMEITLKHSLEEVNCILQALGQRPFTEVADLINKIRMSATSQLTAAQPPVAPPVETDETAQ
jgi:hypothetical protein